MAKNWSKKAQIKNKTTLFYETFKVLTIKVDLFFHLSPFGPLLHSFLLFVKKIK